MIRFVQSRVGVGGWRGADVCGAGTAATLGGPLGARQAVHGARASDAHDGATAARGEAAFPEG